MEKSARSCESSKLEKAKTATLLASSLLIVKLGSGVHGPLAQQPVVVAQKKGREKLEDAINNGTDCVSTRKLITLTETNTCNNVSCSPSHHGVTLEGSNAGPDRGHVFYNGRPLCSETEEGTATTWNLNAAKVVCRMLGFSTATAYSQDQCKHGDCPPAGISFAKSGFKCTGSETHILECPHDTNVVDNCGSQGATSGRTDIVGVTCA